MSRYLADKNVCATVTAVNLQRVYDAHLMSVRTGPNDALVHVAVGLLFNAEGRVLICMRTAERSYAGYWEFPGGKVEPGESVLQTLVRELREEVDVHVLSATHCLTVHHAHPQFRVQLEFFTVNEYHGEAHGAEGQRVQWVAVEELPRINLLTANQKIVEYLLHHHA